MLLLPLLPLLPLPLLSSTSSSDVQIAFTYRIITLFQSGQMSGNCQFISVSLYYMRSYVYFSLPNLRHTFATCATLCETFHASIDVSLCHHLCSLYIMYFCYYYYYYCAAAATEGKRLLLLVTSTLVHFRLIST